MKIFYFQIVYWDCNSKSHTKRGFLLAESEESAREVIESEYGKSSSFWVEERKVIELSKYQVDESDA